MSNTTPRPSSRPSLHSDTRDEAGGQLEFNHPRLEGRLYYSEIVNSTWILVQFQWKKEAEASVDGVDVSQIINRPDSPMLGFLFIILRDGGQHACRDISRNTLIKGKHVVRTPRHQLEVWNVGRGGTPGEETRNHAILAE